MKSPPILTRQPKRLIIPRSELLKRKDAKSVLDATGRVLVDNPARREFLPTGAAPIVITTRREVEPALPSDIGDTFDATGMLLFGDSDTPSIHHIAQRIDDCYFMGDLAAIAFSAPKALRTIVRKVDDKFVVSFHQFTFNASGQLIRDDITDVIVSAILPTDKLQLAGAIWPLVIQKAYACFRTGANTYASLNVGLESHALGHLGFLSAYYDIASPYWTTAAMAFLSEGRAMVISTPGNVGSMPIHPNHTVALIRVFIDANGVTWLQTYNQWGIDGYGSDTNPLDGIQTLPWSQWSKIGARSIVALEAVFPIEGGAAPPSVLGNGLPPELNRLYKGRLTPPTPGKYTLHLTGESVRLKIGDVWKNVQPKQQVTAAVTLNKSALVTIEAKGDARFEWEAPGMPREVIPAEQWVRA